MGAIRVSAEAVALGSGIHGSLVKQWLADVSFPVADAAASSNRFYAASLTLSASATSTIDLSALTGPMGETINFSMINAILLKCPSTNAVEITAAIGASNGWAGFGTAWTVYIGPGGLLAWGYIAGGAVDGTHKTILFTNTSGAVSQTIEYLIMGRDPQ